MKDLWKPKSLVHLDELSKELHKVIVDILNVSSKTVFGLSPEELSKKDVPILSKSDSESFGLLDIAYYTHEKFANQSAVSESVAPHFDPGILSINVLSSEQGLQFQDAAGNWVDVPIGNFVGVIWAGEMAKIISNEKIKPGVHRVQTFPGKLTRLSIWIEACTKLQDISTSMPILESIVVEKKKKFHFGPNTDVPKLAEIEVHPGEKLSDVLWKASRQYGMPMTKSIRYYCPFCLETVGSLLKHAEEKHKTVIKYIGGVEPASAPSNGDYDEW